MIKFNVPTVVGKEIQYLQEVVKEGKFSGGRSYSLACGSLLREMLSSHSVTMVTSCTHALEMSAILCDIKPGDEVIMPSYAFTSTANAFVLRGARIVFVDIRPDTMNIDENLIAGAITSRTRAVVALHYAGVSCEMDPIIELCRAKGLFLVEDAAQAILSGYKGRSCGSMGHFGCISFHETKNAQCGEGGALSVNDPSYAERSEFIAEKGTNRSKFFRGEIQKYTWVDIGSSYVLSELNSAFLYAQLEVLPGIIENRMSSWNLYYGILKPLEEDGVIGLPVVPDGCEHNAHIFYIKTGGLEERASLIEHLHSSGVMAVFHYQPLHSSPAGRRFGEFVGEDRWTTRESERILRLPLYYAMPESDVRKVSDAVYGYYGIKPR